MSRPRVPEPGLLLFSILGADWEAFWPGLLGELEALYGRAGHVSRPLSFAQTGYYDAELGSPVTRRVVAFEELAPLDCLPGVKLAALDLEARHARADGRRVCNLDPGLLTQERLVLATCKNFTHRVYLGRAVWADLTLIWTGGGWYTLPWTFPDYAGAELQDVLTRLREDYRARLFARRAANPEASASGTI